MEKNQKCWTITAIILFIIGALLLVAGLVVELSVFPKVVKDGVNKGKVLGLNKDGTFNSFTQTWAFPQYISTMQYWTFDYKNTIGMLNRGLYPDVIEKGPYAYTETLLNDNINFSEDGKKMNFSQATRYVFNPSKSCPTCDPYKDTVTVPDISFIVAMNAIESMVEGLLQNPNIVGICNLIENKLNKEGVCQKVAVLIERELAVLMDMFNVSPYVTVTVDQLLFTGYNIPILDKLVNKIIGIINEMLGQQVIKPFPPTLVQLNSLNGTTPYLYTVLTGKEDPDLSGYTQAFYPHDNGTWSSNGDSLPADWWPTSNKGNCTGDNGNHALKLFGTNADFFKSYIKKDEQLPIYVDDVCRSFMLKYDREVKVQGFDGYRFVIPPTEFDWSVPENCGFCVPITYGAYDLPANSSCMPSGILDVSQCSGNMPIFISKAHFYQADPKVSQFVKRFKPSYENDETVLDIEPYTGTVLNAQKRLQINVFMNQMPKIAAYSVLRPGAYPLVWLNESFIIDQGTKDQLNSQLFTPKKIVTIICWTAVGVGGFLMVLSLLICFITFCVKGAAASKKFN